MEEGHGWLTEIDQEQSCDRFSTRFISDFVFGDQSSFQRVKNKTRLKKGLENGQESNGDLHVHRTFVG